MKKFKALVLVTILILSVCSFSVFSKVTDTTLNINGSAVTLSSHIEYANGMYYISTKELSSFGFIHDENSSEYVLSRFDKELRVNKVGNTVYKNGAATDFENAVILASKQNGNFYVSAELLRDYFCTAGSISDESISLTLADFTSSVEKIIVGTISLSSGVAESDMLYTVDASASDTYSVSVTLPKGQQSVSYRLPVYSPDTYFTIRCKQVNATDVQGYTSEVYYSTKGTATSLLLASRPAVSGNFIANFVIAPTVSLSGSISGSGEGVIFVTDEKGNVINSSEFYSSSTTYNIVLPSQTQNAYLRYKVYSSDGNVRYGYYSTDATSSFSEDASLLDLSLDSIFNMDLISGRTISGTITWDNSDASFCSIKAMTLDGKYVTDANIYTTSDTTFSIIVPYNTYSDYLLVVNTDENSFGKYVTEEGLTNSLDEALLYTVTFGDITNASVIIDSNAKSNKIYGVLSLPEGLTASIDIPVDIIAGPLTKNVSVANGAYTITPDYTASATIFAGMSTVDYELDLGSDYAGQPIALCYKIGPRNITGYFDGYSKTILSTEKDISFDATKINNIDMQIFADSATDITAIKDGSGNEYTSSSDLSTIVVSLKNLTNIDRTGKIFVSAYDNVNALVASGYSEYTAEGSLSQEITINLDGNMNAVKFLKVLTLDQNNNLIARDIIIL